MLRAGIIAAGAGIARPGSPAIPARRNRAGMGRPMVARRMTAVRLFSPFFQISSPVRRCRGSDARSIGDGRVVSGRQPWGSGCAWRPSNVRAITHQPPAVPTARRERFDGQFPALPPRRLHRSQHHGRRAPVDAKCRRPGLADRASRRSPRHPGESVEQGCERSRRWLSLGFQGGLHAGVLGKQTASIGDEEAASAAQER